MTALAPPLGVYAAGLVSYALVASLNWWLNRRWTYRHVAHGRLAPQWARFMGANLVGLVLNRGSYAALLALWPPAHRHLVLPVACGGIAGMFANFFLSRRWVDREAPRSPMP